MDNKQCECNKSKVVNYLLKRISNLEFEVEDKQREIEFLKQINEEHKKINGELRVENERLNNIINEFDKLIENEINESKLEDNYERVDSLEYCLATLRELKGSDK